MVTFFPKSLLLTILVISHFFHLSWFMKTSRIFSVWRFVFLYNLGGKTKSGNIAFPLYHTDIAELLAHAHFIIGFLSLAAVASSSFSLSLSTSQCVLAKCSKVSKVINRVLCLPSGFLYQIWLYSKVVVCCPIRAINTSNQII